jgi:hypothetical protein
MAHITGIALTYSRILPSQENEVPAEFATGMFAMCREYTGALTLAPTAAVGSIPSVNIPAVNVIPTVKYRSRNPPTMGVPAT